MSEEKLQSWQSRRPSAGRSEMLSCISCPTKEHDLALCISTQELIALIVFDPSPAVKPVCDSVATTFIAVWIVASEVENLAAILSSPYCHTLRSALHLLRFPSQHFSIDLPITAKMPARAPEE